MRWSAGRGCHTNDVRQRGPLLQRERARRQMLASLPPTPNKRGNPGLRPHASADPREPELDLVERTFGRLFGRQALNDPNPLGMKRLSAEASKELYPAVTDVFAEPLEADTADIQVLRPLLAQTQLERIPLRLAFDAQQHGWDASAFHQLVDGFGAALVVAETQGGATCGGYNPRGWISLGEDRDSTAAFLFTWPARNGSSRPVKLPKVGGPGLAVVRDQPGSGIFFGPDGLSIPLARGNERAAKCKLGPFYSRMPGGGKSLFAEGEQSTAQLVSLRVYVAEGTGEEWTLEGIVWKTQGGESS